MKNIKYVSLIALALYSHSAFTMESNRQEARSNTQSPTLMEEIKQALPENLDARIAALKEKEKETKGIVTRSNVEAKALIFKEVESNMHLLLARLVARMPENALEMAAQIQERVKNIAMRLWGAAYQTHPLYEAWLKRYKREFARISRGESLDERLKRPIFKEIKPMPMPEKDTEFEKLMRSQARRRKQQNMLHEEVRDLLSQREGISLTPTERMKIQDIERKEQELAAMRADQQDQTVEELKAAAEAAQNETQALRKEVQNLLKERSGLSQAATAKEQQDKKERFNNLISTPRNRLNTFNSQDILSENDAHEVMRILDGVEYTAQKLWSDYGRNHPLYKQWLIDTADIREKAERVLYGDMPGLE